METISLKEVLDELDSGRKCDLVVITCDRVKGEGGEILELLGVRKSNWQSMHEHKMQSKLQPASKKKIQKNPAHYANSTRNVVLPSGNIRKIHIRLIRKFNGMTVL